MTKPILPGSVPHAVAPTSTSHVHLHAHGAKKGVRGKGGQPGELVHEESYTDKIDDHPPAAAGRRPAALPGAGLSVPTGNRASPGLSRPPMGLPPRGERDNQQQAALKQANQTKQALSALVQGKSAHADTAQLALRGMDQKLALAGVLRTGAGQAARAQGAMAAFDAKLRLGSALAGPSPHLAAAQAACGRIHALTERLAKEA